MIDMADDPLLTAEEVARKLHVHIETVRRWIRSGELRAIDLGGPAGYRITNQSSIVSSVNGQPSETIDTTPLG
jgi:excisionase family DNA binding protein